MNRYSSVYFRIKSGYGANGMADEDKRSFYSEVKSLFEKAGWSIKEHSVGCPTAHKEKQELYLHPQSFSGLVCRYEITDIETSLAKAVTFKHYHTDVYEEYWDITDAEYLAELQKSRDLIITDIISAFTKKPGQRHVVKHFDVLGAVISEHDINVLKYKNAIVSPVASKFIWSIFIDLVASGRIVQNSAGTSYQAASHGSAA